MARTIVGLFGSLNAAEGAVKDLTNAGLPRGSIGLISAAAKSGRQDDAETTRPAIAGAGIGAAGGALVGGAAGLLAGIGVLAVPGVGPILAAGPLLATLTGAGAGAAVGAVAGGLVGVLMDLGISEAEARRYAEGVRAGGTLVTVTADEARLTRAAETMRRCGAQEIDKEPRERVWPVRQGAVPGRQAGGEPGGLPEDLDRPPGVAAQGMMASSAHQSTEEEFRGHFESSLSRRGDRFEEYAPAYEYGAEAAQALAGRDWDLAIGQLREMWERENPGTWERFEDAIRYGWERRRG
jgi:hypothetical protein